MRRLRRLVAPVLTAVRGLAPVTHQVRAIEDPGRRPQHTHAPAQVAPTARVIGPVGLGADVTIADHASLVAGGGGGAVRLSVAPGARVCRFATVIAQLSVRIDSGAVLGDLAVVTDSWDLPGARTVDVPAPPPAPVVIGEGARLGAGSVVCPGVTVGPWAVVAPGAVVVDDIPEHGQVAGNPARPLGVSP